MGRQALLPEWVVPVVPEGRVLTGTAVVLDGERIEALVPIAELDAACPDAERIDLPGRALMPGLVNMHTHSAMALLRGLADDLPLMRWLEDHIWPAEGRLMGPDYVRAGTELAIAEMLRGGTTTFNDNYFFPDVTAEVAVRVGMRAVVGMPVIRFPTAWAQTEDEYFRRGLEVHERFQGEPLVGVTFVPHAPYSVDDSAFERIRTLAEELDLVVHLHLLEAAGEIESSRREHGMHPLDRLEKLGLLGPRLLAVHMTQLSAADILRLARAGVHVVHCPDSNLKLASGICPVAELDAAGVNVCIGTDGAASNNDLDLLAETRLAALLAKGRSGNPEAVPAARALSMATLHGARALGMEDRIGSIEAGKQADLAAIRLDCIETEPVHHVISQLVYAAPRCQFTDVWVAGRRLLNDRSLTTLDEAALLTQTRNWRQRIATLPTEADA
ncbi:TRZ/ATZ family hydrolase [Wenzhouxiangella sp. XN79A]|uniref:TRZ/ATZ family hydrolase n=1 Tax=Wenzhouxiangella sp. XN79A TaxID=2724193 RepID=UPI00144AD101|nr:TRZ/ATZ family hydrolase [Wenzhouxiangella sp. XN79A]NKI36018.1 TRZ/ATZ family hydrolase [Wenzhouxiangella sp. XN79A]